MKKIFAIVLAFLCVFSASSVQKSNAVYAGFIIEKDAKTAVKKNMEIFLKNLEEAEITNDFTSDDLENMVFSACQYSTDAKIGSGIMVEKFKKVNATASKDGYISAAVSIYQDDGEEAYEIKKTIPALSGESKPGGLDTNDGNKEDENKYSDAELSEIKKSITKAKSAISAAIWNLDVSNDTTAEDILKMAKDAVGSGDVSVALEEGNFSVIKSSSTVNGTVSATLTLTCRGIEDAVSVAKTIPLVVNETTKAIDEDRHLIEVAVDAIDYNNRITKEDILNVAKKAVKNGTNVEWKTFNKTNATFKEEGKVTVCLVMTLREETRETYYTRTIPVLVRNIPEKRISVNKEEWEILRITNVERNKDGAMLLTMPEVLQQACNIREVEIAEKFSHTRPDGSNPFTAISDFKYIKGGENIYKCDSQTRLVSGERAMNSWMNSPGHRANILTKDFDYMGVGAYDNDVTGTAVQLFGGVAYPLVSAVTASGKTNYIDTDEMQKDYLICTASTGMLSYVPLDLEYMTKTEKGYTLNLRMGNKIYLTVGEETEPTENIKPENVERFTDVKTTDYFGEAVRWAIEKGVTAGTSETTFSPADTCTRAQILTFLWRAVGEPKTALTNPFSDISQDDYYYDAAIWAYKKGMVPAGKFEANTPCTRASTVTYLWKNAGSLNPTGVSSFSDVSSAADYAKAVSWAVEKGVTAGTSETTFSPDMICDRGQIVTFLHRALN